jgi:hypothetical protein
MCHDPEISPRSSPERIGWENSLLVAGALAVVAAVLWLWIRPAVISSVGVASGGATEVQRVSFPETNE